MKPRLRSVCVFLFIIKTIFVEIAYSDDLKTKKDAMDKAMNDYSIALKKLKDFSSAEVDKLRNQILLPATQDYERSKAEYLENERKRIQSTADQGNREDTRKLKAAVGKSPSEAEIEKIARKMEEDLKSGKINTSLKAPAGSETEKVIKQKIEKAQKDKKEGKVSHDSIGTVASSPGGPSTSQEGYSSLQGASGQPKATGVEREKYELDANGIAKEVEFSGKKDLSKGSDSLSITPVPIAPAGANEPEAKGDGQTTEIEFPGKGKSGKK